MDRRVVSSAAFTAEAVPVLTRAPAGNDRPTLLQRLFPRSVGQMTQEQGHALSRIALAVVGFVVFFPASRYG